MEVTNKLQTRAYKLNDKKVPIIKKLARKGELQFIHSEIPKKRHAELEELFKRHNENLTTT